MRKNTLPLLAVLTFVIILAACGTFVQASAATRTCPTQQNINATSHVVNH